MPHPWAFSWEPLFLALTLLAAFLYARAARDERPPKTRIIVFALGLALIVAALCSPLETIARRYLLLFHLLLLANPRTSGLQRIIAGESKRKNPKTLATQVAPE